jgi:outer membrane protein
LSFFKGGNISKIGVVDMDKLVYEFRGMKEATNNYTNKMTDWTKESDSIENQLRKYVQDIKMDSLNGDKKKLNLDKQRFILLRKTYFEFQQKIQEKSQQEDQKMTSGVINQIKSYMEEYAVKNGFELILTNTQMQSVGYVRSVHDITHDVLIYSNDRFEGEN